MWSILSALFPPSNHNHHSNRVSNFESHVNKLDFSSIKFPVTLPQFREFERLNVGFTVNVHFSSKNDIVPVYLSKHRTRPKQIELLLLKQNDNNHYVWIKDISRLVNTRTQHKGRTYVCPHCVFPFTRKPHSILNSLIVVSICVKFTNFLKIPMYN